MIIDSHEAARRLGISTCRIKQLLRANRIHGSKKIGGRRCAWIIEIPEYGKPVILPPVKT
jgi:hypothetical protein